MSPQCLPEPADTRGTVMARLAVSLSLTWLLFLGLGMTASFLCAVSLRWRCLIREAALQP
jgi:hypothetical protein